MCSRETSTGAAFTELVVKTAAAVAGTSEKMSARSLRPGFFIAASTEENVKPRSVIKIHLFFG
jgi:hypothetical protein